MTNKAAGAAMHFKLFVFDLDETIWTVSEGLCSMVRPPFHKPHPDRVEDEHGFWVELKPGVRKLFEYLKSRGCYVSIASRNEPAPTMALLDALEISQLLDFPQLAWRPKQESIQRIVKEIHKRDKTTVKTGEILFIDDWPENIVPVRAWGATAFQFGQDFETFAELLAMLR